MTPWSPLSKVLIGTSDLLSHTHAKNRHIGEIELMAASSAVLADLAILDIIESSKKPQD